MENNLKIRNKSMTYEEIAEVMCITVKEVKDIEKSALKKLKHPKLGSRLKKYINM